MAEINLERVTIEDCLDNYKYKDKEIALLPPTKVKAMLNKQNTLGYFYPYFNKKTEKVKFS